VYGLAIKPLWTIHIILLLYKDGQKNIGENSDMPSLTVTSFIFLTTIFSSNVVDKLYSYKRHEKRSPEIRARNTWDRKKC
jgi:hypothetical protein